MEKKTHLGDSHLALQYRSHKIDRQPPEGSDESNPSVEPSPPARLVDVSVNTPVSRTARTARNRRSADLRNKFLPCEYNNNTGSYGIKSQSNHSILVIPRTKLVGDG